MPSIIGSRLNAFKSFLLMQISFSVITSNQMPSLDFKRVVCISKILL